ncbi:hypothetical protein [Brevibacillus laterosporus]|uniref:hypothetical protein n=1 Tax=Brevibacillus laterosporus TaxID=1465 RepID=UPI00265D5525|nr:hypothetical protein [Brevibacillus laterosporus]
MAADIHLLEKLIGFSATLGQYLDMQTGFLRLPMLPYAWSQQMLTALVILSQKYCF